MKATDENASKVRILNYGTMTRIDIYRNLELHDEDKDSVVQTTVQYPTDTTDNPIEKLLTTFLKQKIWALASWFPLIAIGHPKLELSLYPSR